MSSVLVTVRLTMTTRSWPGLRFNTHWSAGSDRVMMPCCATSTGVPRRDQRAGDAAAAAHERPGQVRRDPGPATPDHGPATAAARPTGPQLPVVLGRIAVTRVGVGHPRKRPDLVLADRAYTSRANRAYLRRRGDPRLHPRQGRSGRRPPGQRLPRRTPDHHRSDCLPPAPRGRMRHQPTQTPSSHGHPLRQTRRPLEATLTVAAINQWLKTP
jgi:hypothetical protein